PEESPGMKLFKNKWFWIGAGVLVVLVSIFGALQSRRGKTQSVTVSAARVKDVVMTVKAPGAIEPRTIVKISADIPGRVVHLAVHEGDDVKRGQLLLELDNTQYDSSVRQTQASLVAARSRAAQAATAWKLAQAQYERRKALFERKLLSTQEMDTAENDYASARSAADAAREDVSRLSAALTGARDNLSKTTYRSPIDGKITALNIEEGEIVVTGTMNNAGTQILTVADISRMLVKADVDETDVVDIRPGQTAKITVDALPDTTFAGVVTEVGNSASRETNTAGASGQTNFEVKVLFHDTVAAVRPGMTADVEIEVKRADKALAVPIQSVVVRQPEDLKKRGEKKKPAAETETGDALAAADDEYDPLARKKRELTGVFVKVADHAEFRKVKTGITSETDIQILPASELKVGEVVITGPYKVLRDLKPGDRVAVQKKGKTSGSARSGS
ncbi:MAG: efflux RND transporter periplasmic adaptor subunit, partial [Candidatus Eisenbacteria bacterium]